MTAPLTEAKEATCPGKGFRARHPAGSGG